MRKKIAYILVALLLTGLIATIIPLFIPTSSAATADSGWALVKDAGAVKAYPDLREYIWQKNATMPPNGPYDKIGLHRLIKANVTPRGVVFVTNCPMWGAGEQRITNPPSDNWIKYENYSSAIYYANRGFDVYAIDYRPHFVPKTLNASDMSFAASWGWDVWISDIKEAAEKVKQVSGASKFFISGECTGGEAALNYATKYQTDLLGIVLVDANFPPAASYPIVGTLNGTNTFNLTQALRTMNASKNYANDAFAGLRGLASYALQNPAGPARYPNGTSLTPPLNPLTNKTWANITEWFSVIVYNNFGAGANATMPLGSISNTVGGYGNVSQDIFTFANSEFLPTRIFLENQAMVDWVNCPYISYDFNDHYKEINVPIVAFATGLYSNRSGTFRFVNGTANPDCTGVYLPRYGHVDAFFGTYSARDVSEPAYQWMLNRLPSNWSLVATRGVKAYSDLREYFWQKNASMAPHGPYDKIGLHRVVKAGNATKGVVFMLPGLYGNGEALVSNPPNSNYTLTENMSNCIYWANRGFDVYAFDYRSHFVPATLNASQLSFMLDWSIDMFMSDIREAIGQAKIVSNVTKVYLAGQSMGATWAQFYASEYWLQDLQGLVLLDPGPSPSIIAKNRILTNSYNVTTEVNKARQFGNWSWERPQTSFVPSPLNPGYIFLTRYAWQNPAAPAVWPNGTLLQPTVNPRTNRTWANITEWFAYGLNSGNSSNTYGGYGNITVDMQYQSFADRYFPVRPFLDSAAMRDWNTTPFSSFDFYSHVKEVNVPVIAFRSGLNVAAYGNITNGMATKSFSVIVLPNYGHMDVFVGTYSARDVSEPAYQWMLIHTNPVSVDAATAYRMMTNGSYPNLLILDVRNQSEYNTGYIPGAVLIPVWQLQQRIGELSQYKNSPILTYCRSGVRGQNASQILAANGFTKVYNLLGGLIAWNSSGYPIVYPVPTPTQTPQLTSTPPPTQQPTPTRSASPQPTTTTPPTQPTTQTIYVIIICGIVVIITTAPLTLQKLTRSKTR